MNHEASNLRLHMGCGEPLRSRLLLGVPHVPLWGDADKSARDLRLSTKAKRRRTRK